MQIAYFPKKSIILPMLGALLIAGCEDGRGGLPLGVPEAMVIDGEVSPAPAIVAEAPVIAPRSRPVPRVGVVTAGDIDDALNLAEFRRYLGKTKRETGLPSANFARPVLIQLVLPDGRPAPGVRITLSKPGAAEPFYDGYSGVDGNVTVFPALYGVRRLSNVHLRAFGGQQTGDLQVRMKVSDNRRQAVVPFAGSWQPDFLDLAFVVDTTGSMADELAWLTRELRGIVADARRAAPAVNIRYGLIVYRDRGDAYVVRNYGFTASQAEMVGWLKGQRAAGGGDYPEAAAEALAAGVALDWRRGRGERLMFHIADAPPHDGDARAYLRAARKAAGRKVQIFGLGASGVAAESEYLMRQAALATGGRYIFLTDDSGVGFAHAEPTVSCYRVTKLKDLMGRILRSELTGIRQEAARTGVVREVGSYRRGVCRN